MSVHAVYLAIFYSSLSSSIASAYISLKNQDRRLRPLILLVGASVAFDLVLGISADILDYHIPYVGYFYRLVEFVLLIEFYSYFTSGKNKIGLRIIQVLIPLTFLVFFEWSVSIVRLNNSILFCLAPVMLYFDQGRTLAFGDILKSSIFWANSAIFIYFSGNLFFFLLFKSIASTDRNAALISYCLHNMLLITRNILLALSFLKSKNMSQQHA